MLFAFDLDGTLLDETHKIKKESITAINHLKKKGHTIAIATGRGFMDSIEFANEVNADYTICFNGMWNYDNNNKTYVRKIMGDPEEAKKIVNNIGSVMSNLFVQTDKSSLPIHYDFVNQIPHPPIDWVETKKYTELSKEIIDEHCNSVVTLAGGGFDDSEDVKELFRKLDIKLFEPLPLRTPSQFNWMDVRFNHNTKAVAIAELAEILDFSDDQIIMFGDSLNDFEAVDKYYGIAMGSGNDDLKKVANEIIGPNSEPSIHDWIMKKFK